MKMRDIFQQFRIDVIGTTVFITNHDYNFSYTPVTDIVKPEYQDQYRYFGGLQCGFEVNTPEYVRLEGWLCDLAEATLKQVKAIKKTNQIEKEEA